MMFQLIFLTFSNRHFFGPKRRMNLKKKRKSKYRTPTVATSATWQEFQRAKEREDLREAKVEKRKKLRLEMTENKKSSRGGKN